MRKVTRKKDLQQRAVVSYRLGYYNKKLNINTRSELLDSPSEILERCTPTKDMIVLGVTSTTDMGDFTEVRKGMQAELQTERIFLIF